jgi:hypothetical protein
MQIQIYSRETTVVEYEVQPEHGWTRNDIVRALQDGQARVSGGQIVKDGESIGTILSSGVVQSKSGIEWS